MSAWLFRICASRVWCLRFACLLFVVYASRVCGLRFACLLFVVCCLGFALRVFDVCGLLFGGVALCVFDVCGLLFRIYASRV